MTKKYIYYKLSRSKIFLFNNTSTILVCKSSFYLILLLRFKKTLGELKMNKILKGRYQIIQP